MQLCLNYKHYSVTKFIEWEFYNISKPYGEAYVFLIVIAALVSISIGSQDALMNGWNEG